MCPSFECQVALMEGFSSLGAMPSVDELPGSFLLHLAADCDFDFVHWVPRNLCTSAQKSAKSRSTVVKE